MPLTSLFTRRQPSVRTSHQPCPWLGLSSECVPGSHNIAVRVLGQGCSACPGAAASWGHSWQTRLCPWRLFCLQGPGKCPPGYGYSSPAMKKCIRYLKDPGTLLAPYSFLSVSPWACPFRAPQEVKSSSEFCAWWRHPARHTVPTGEDGIFSRWLGSVGSSELGALFFRG